MTFRTIVQQSGKTATGIVVPDEVVAALGAGRHPAVVATVAGHAYRSHVASMGGRFMLPVSAEVRAVAGVAAGDEVDVELRVDDQPRQLAPPPDLAEALAADAAARAFFDGLSYSARRWYVLQVEDAKTPETRRRRVEKALAMLREGRRP